RAHAGGHQHVAVAAAADVGQPVRAAVLLRGPAVAEAVHVKAADAVFAQPAGVVVIAFLAGLVLLAHDHQVALTVQVMRADRSRLVLHPYTGGGDRKSTRLNSSHV